MYSVLGKNSNNLLPFSLWQENIDQTGNILLKSWANHDSSPQYSTSRFASNILVGKLLVKCNEQNISWNFLKTLSYSSF